MKIVMSAIAMIALLGFVGSVHAAKEHKPTPGHFVKIDGKEIVYVGGAKAKGAEHRAAIDDSTKFSIDGKDVTLAEFEKNVTANEYLDLTLVKDKTDEKKKVATAVAAFATPPAAPAKK